MHLEVLAPHDRYRPAHGRRGAAHAPTTQTVADEAEVCLSVKAFLSLEPENPDSTVLFAWVAFEQARPGPPTTRSLV